MWVHIAIGAAIGGIVNASISAATQYKTTGEIDFAKTAIAFGAGAASGALAATGVGLAGQIAGNGLISGASNIMDQLNSNCGDFSGLDKMELAENIALGFVAGYAGGPGANSNGHLMNLGKQLTHRLSNAFEHKTGDALKSEITKALGYYIKNSGGINKEMIKGIIRSSIPSLMNEVLGGEEGINNMVKDLEGYCN
jgi:hypothetical protein